MPLALPVLISESSQSEFALAEPAAHILNGLLATGCSLFFTRRMLARMTHEQTIRQHR